MAERASGSWDSWIANEADQAAVAAVAAAIAGRRNVKQFVPRPVPRALIERLLDLAVWAPNHRLTEPWRFYIFDGPALGRLGEVAGAVSGEALAAAGSADPALIGRKAAEAASAWSTLPVAIFVTATSDPSPEIDLENYGAACCAVQNLMLLAEAAGLATSWSSGAVAAAPALRRLVGAEESERMVGLIRLGFRDPAAPPRSAERRPSAALTTWVAGR